MTNWLKVYGFNKITSIILLLVLCTNINAKQKFQVFNASNGLLDNSAQQIVCLKDGRMIIATLGNINFFDGANFYYIHSKYDKYYFLKSYYANCRIYIDNRNNLWMKDMHRLYCVNLKTECYENTRFVIRRLGIRKQITDMYATDKGSLWFVLGTNYIYGVDSKVMLHLPLVNCDLQDISVYKDKYLMLFYKDGSIFSYDIISRRLLYKERDNRLSIKNDNDKSTSIVTNNKLYFQILNGNRNSLLICFDANTKRNNKIIQVPFGLNSMAFKDSNHLYIASENGYFIYNLYNKRLEYKNKVSISDGKSVNANINTICFDKQGGLWLGTEKRGVLYSKPVDSPFYLINWKNPLSIRIAKKIEKIKTKTVYNNQEYNCVLKQDKRTWVGTDDGLVLYYDNKRIKTFNNKDGLPNNVIHSIVCDKKGNLWVSTSNGIACIMYNSMRLSYDIHNFTQRDGTGYELYDKGKSILLNDGRIAMQGIDNITIFDPNTVISNISIKQTQRESLKPIIVSFFDMGNRVEVGREYDGHIILDKAISQTDHIALKYNQNNVTFIVSAMNYYRPNETFFRYRLLGGEDTSWHLISTYSFEGRSAKDGEVSINFNNLSPGEYQLEIQASMFKDQWHGGKKRLTISISQPWWKKTGPQFALGFIIIILCIANFRLYSKVIKLRLKQKIIDDNIILRLNNYFNNCNRMSGSVLSPSPSSTLYGDSDYENRFIKSKELDFIRKIIPYLSNRQTNELSIELLCAETRLTREEVYGYSKRILNTHLRLMTIILRLNHAKKLLVCTNSSISTISSTVRFINEDFFRSCFINEYKCSPEEYRLDHSNENNVI